MEWEEASFSMGTEMTRRPCMNLLPSGPQFSQPDKQEGDGCHLNGTCVPRPGVPFLALVSCLPFPHERPLVSLGHDLHFPTGRWTSSWTPVCASSTPQWRSPAPPDLPRHPGLRAGPFPALFPLPPPARGCGCLALWGLKPWHLSGLKLVGTRKTKTSVQQLQ